MILVEYCYGILCKVKLNLDFETHVGKEIWFARRRVNAYLWLKYRKQLVTEFCGKVGVCTIVPRIILL